MVSNLPSSALPSVTPEAKSWLAENFEECKRQIEANFPDITNIRLTNEGKKIECDDKIEFYYPSGQHFFHKFTRYFENVPNYETFIKQIDTDVLSSQLYVDLATDAYYPWQKINYSGRGAHDTQLHFQVVCKGGTKQTFKLELDPYNEFITKVEAVMQQALQKLPAEKVASILNKKEKLVSFVKEIEYVRSRIDNLKTEIKLKQSTQPDEKAETENEKTKKLQEEVKELTEETKELETAHVQLIDEVTKIVDPKEPNSIGDDLSEVVSATSSSCLQPQQIKEMLQKRVYSFTTGHLDFDLIEARILDEFPDAVAKTWSPPISRGSKPGEKSAPQTGVSKQKTFKHISLKPQDLRKPAV